MAKEKKEVKATIAKAIFVSVATILVIGGFTLLFSWADKQDRKTHLKQAACWNEIYDVMVKSSKERADWIRQTVTSDTKLLGGVDYCNTLEFINSGVSKREIRAPD